LLLVILRASQVVHSGNWRSKSDFQSYWHCQPPRFEWSRAVRRLRRKEEGMHDEHVNLCKFFRNSVHDINVEIYMVHQYLSLYCIYSASCQGRTRSPGHLHVYPGSFQPKTIYHFWLHFKLMNLRFWAQLNFMWCLSIEETKGEYGGKGTL